MPQGPEGLYLTVQRRTSSQGLTQQTTLLPWLSPEDVTKRIGHELREDLAGDLGTVQALYVGAIRPGEAFGPDRKLFIFPTSKEGGR
ncbi:MAG TPA: hypothetical protein VM223_24665 [Planctomycetota bacterium]|nr:hypothetical protein [Planctomycetota bacterium]